MGIAYADINGLKWTNDNLGHKAGDELIIKFANLLKINFKDCKTYHISGDEFIIMSLDNIRCFLSSALTFHKSLWSSTDVPLASMGYSVGKAEELDAIIEDAEKTMRDDKSIFYSKFPKFRRI